MADERSLDFSGTDDSSVPDFDSADSNSGVGGLDAADSQPQGSEQTEAQATDNESSPEDAVQLGQRILDGLSPNSAIVGQERVSKLYADVKSLLGRAAAAQRGGSQATDRQVRDARSWNEVAGVPGIATLFRSGRAQDPQNFLLGVQALAGHFGIDLDSVLGGSAPAQQPANGNGQGGGVDVNADWTKLSKEQFPQWIQAQINQGVNKILQSHVYPMYQQMSGMQRGSELAMLRQKYPDLPKFERAINTLSEKYPGMGLEEAYGMAKWQAGGFVRTQPNAQRGVSEQPRAPIGEQVGADEQIRRMVIGSRGSRTLD